jgi:hypothetical protein
MSHELQAGDILYYKWGYDQTNVQFFQVLSITDKTATVQEIEAELATPPKPQDMSDQCVAKRDVFKKNSKPLRKVVQAGNQLSFDYGTAYLWDGKPQYRSWYA